MGIVDNTWTLVTIVSNYLVYYLMNSDYRYDMLQLQIRYSQALLYDFETYFTPFNFPEGVEWSLQEQIENRGYLFEEHTVQTRDGYLLTVYRIPGKLVNNQKVLG